MSFQGTRALQTSFYVSSINISPGGHILYVCKERSSDDWASQTNTGQGTVSYSRPCSLIFLFVGVWYIAIRTQKNNQPIEIMDDDDTDEYFVDADGFIHVD